MSSTPARSSERRPAAVELTDVHKVYRVGRPVPVLNGISLSLSPGSFTAIMGPSGSGKSTLLNLIGCLDRPTVGRIEIDGRDVTELSDRQRTDLRGAEIGFVFQSFNLMPRMTALENVELPMVLGGVSRRRRRERARELVASVDLEHRGHHRPNELSGGQRQRVAIARALANEPSLVLADEPTGNLDTETGTRILSLFDDLNARGITILLISHERYVAEHASRIVHLVDGTIERIERVEGQPDGRSAWIQ